MSPPRSKKRAPSFRRLMKTSGLKLDNKMKSRRAKQQSVAKQQRKEQKKLRQAIKETAIRRPRPLETYSKTPEEERRQQEEEEEFLENLPTDMLEEDDLQEMKAFITRDLSSCGPVHSGKRRRGEEVLRRSSEEVLRRSSEEVLRRSSEEVMRRSSEEVMRSYEKVPRRTERTEETEVVHLLPIKDRRGVVPRSLERVVKKQPEEEEEEEEEEAPDLHQEEDECVSLSLQQIEVQRLQKLKHIKLHVAALGSAVISDPQSNIRKLKELRAMLMEADPSVAVTTRKLVMVSLMEIFKDVAPTYRIRPLTSEEKATKVKKETQQLRDFEEGLVTQYKFYLEDLEQIIKDWRQQKEKRSQAVAFRSYEGLAEVSVRCLCELLLALPHFNFHNNIIVILVPLMNHTAPQISAMCCDAFRNLFQQDKEGGVSLASVRVVSGLVKSLNYNVRPELLRTLLSLRIQEVQVKKDLEDSRPSRKFMSHKEKKKNLSRMQRKWRKAEEKLEKELLEAEASESQEKKIKLHTEILNVVFLIYFRILKKARKSILLPAVLEGLAKFAHLINLEFFDDLLNTLQGLVQSGDLTNRERLHCIQTAFTVLSGQGEVLTVDPLAFYTALYAALLRLHAAAPADDIIVALRCLDAMLTRRRKRVTLTRAMAFVKRLSTLSLHVLPNASVGALATARNAMHAFPKCDFLLDNEIQGSGFFLPELDQPEHCNAQNTALWELHTLQRHFHPAVKRFASHLRHGAPSEGAESLSRELSRRSPVELCNFYSVDAMTFNPPVAPPGSRKKDRFGNGASLLDDELQRRIDSLMEAGEGAELNFTPHTHTQTHTQ